MARTFKNRVEDFYDELTKAGRFVQDVLGALQSCMEDTENRKDSKGHSLVNLVTKVGIYAVYLRENEEMSFKILFQEKQAFLDAISQVCTGELSVFNAVEFFTNAKNDLDEAIACIDLS